MGKWLDLAVDTTEKEKMPKPALPILSKLPKGGNKDTVDLQPTGNPTIETMQATQPPGWGWWGYLLADGGQGSIRGPYPDRVSALTAVHAEFGQPAIKLNPLPGCLPEPDLPQTDEPKQVTQGNQDLPIVTCRRCSHWTPDRVNPSGGMGRCGRGYSQLHYPWSTCERGK